MTSFLPTREKPWGILQRTVGSILSSNSESLVKYVEFNLTGRCNGGGG